MRGLACMVVLAGLASGCATTTTDLKRLRGTVAGQRNNLKAADASADAAEDQIKTVGKKQTGTRLFIGKGAMLQALKGSTPHHFKGSSLSRKRLRGEFQFKNPRNFKYLSRNRATWTWDFSAKKVSVNLKGVAMTSKKDEVKARDALQGGGTMQMSASLWVDSGKQVLRINARCARVSLRRNNTASHRNYLCDGANKTLFRQQQAVKLPSIFRGKTVKATTTPNHLILISR